MKNLLLFTIVFIASASQLLYGQARVQVIHNSADAAASTVDVWLNNTLLLDDFTFRSASPFIDAPSGADFDVRIQPASSTDTINPIAKFTYNLMAGETYILVANGIVSTTGYTPATPFDILVYGMGQEAAATSGNTDVLVLHGATDAPTVDVVEVGAGAGTIVNDVSYGSFSDYLPLLTTDYALQIRTESGTAIVAEYSAPLAALSLTDSALVVLASGFLDPSMNSNGPVFGLYVALPGGGNLVELPSAPISTSYVQVIHNAADTAASMVDVWLNDTKLLQDFAFRTATEFIDAPAGTPITLSVQPPASTDTVGALYKITTTLTGGDTYILIANGMVSTSGYSPLQAFGLDIFATGQQEAEDPSKTDVLVYHGSTDAPTVDVVETSVPAGTIVDDISYQGFNGYLALDPLDYNLDITDATGATVVASYSAPLSSLNLGGAAITVLASGFLDPTMNSGGEAFGLFVATAGGGALVELPVLTGIKDLLTTDISSTIYPNPASDKLFINTTMEQYEAAELRIFSITGQQVQATLEFDLQPGQNTMEIPTNQLMPGIYLVSIEGSSFINRVIVEIVR